MENVSVRFVQGKFQSEQLQELLRVSNSSTVAYTFSSRLPRTLVKPSPFELLIHPRAPLIASTQFQVTYIVEKHSMHVRSNRTRTCARHSPDRSESVISHLDLAAARLNLVARS
eukprot:434264-Pleurochrysis_carterae.AAC.2